MLGLLAGCATDIQQMREVQPTGGKLPLPRRWPPNNRDFVMLRGRRDVSTGRTPTTSPARAWRRRAARSSFPRNWRAGICRPTRSPELADCPQPPDRGSTVAPRDSNPAIAARAQARFDCWVEQQEENHQADHIAACRTDFLKRDGGTRAASRCGERRIPTSCCSTSTARTSTTPARRCSTRCWRKRRRRAARSASPRQATPTARVRRTTTWRCRCVVPTPCAKP